MPRPLLWQPAIRNALHKIHHHYGPARECAACDQDADQVASSISGVVRDRQKRDKRKAHNDALHPITADEWRDHLRSIGQGQIIERVNQLLDARKLP